MPSAKKSMLHMIIALILVGGSLFAYGYFFSTIRVKNENISKILTSIAGETKKKKELEVVKKNLAITQAAREKISSHFVESNEIVNFLEELEALGTSANALIEVTSVGLGDRKMSGPSAPPPAPASSDPTADNVDGQITAPPPAPTGPTQKIVEVSLKATGSFVDVYQYLLLLENLPYDVEIDRMSMSKGADGSWEGDFSIQLLSFSAS